MAEMRNSGPDVENNKSGGSVRRPRRAAGGKTSKVNVYNAAGSPTVREAEDESEDFKRGGHAKKMDGGMVMGDASKARGDKMPRGRLASGGRAGGSPFSSGRTMTAPKNDDAGRGKEGVKISSEPD